MKVRASIEFFHRAFLDCEDEYVPKFCMFFEKKSLLGISSSGESCWNSTMNTDSKLNWQSIHDCSKNEFDMVMTAGAVATPQSLTTVPWVLVNGKLLVNPESTLMFEICQAYQGPQPASCLSTKLL